MSWRAAVLLPYPVLAVVVAVAYGLDGFLTLLYFYLVAGAWLLFLLVWGSLAQTAGRRNAERVWRTGVLRGRSSSPPRRGESGRTA